MRPDQEFWPEPDRNRIGVNLVGTGLDFTISKTRPDSTGLDKFAVFSTRVDKTIWEVVIFINILYMKSLLTYLLIHMSQESSNFNKFCKTESKIIEMRKQHCCIICAVLILI